MVTDKPILFFLQEADIMKISSGDKVTLSRDWCPDGMTTYRKGTRGVVVRVGGGSLFGAEYEIKFDGHNKTVTMSHSIAEKVLG